MQAWITVGTPENFEVLRKRNFDIAAFKSSRKKQSGEMQPGDRIVFYLTQRVLFGGVVEVTGEAFEDRSDIGLDSEGKPDEDFPYRIQTRPIVIAPPGNEIDVRDITDLLDKTRNFGPKKLGMCFRGNLHKISDADLEVIEGLLRGRAS
ncbi:MAG: EVE domain-containing protein [Dehalococcoidia bacterium]|nr:EVE domain-containing protein [Dehalococcoidia bacterium]